MSTTLGSYVTQTKKLKTQLHHFNITETSIDPELLSSNSNAHFDCFFILLGMRKRYVSASVMSFR